jgi:hypothetical protein
VAGTRQVIGHRGANDTTAKNEYTHSPAPNAPGAARRRRINGLIAGRCLHTPCHISRNLKNAFKTTAWRFLAWRCLKIAVFKS